MLHRSIMLHAEDRIHVLITRLRESAAPPERQALLDELTEIEASVHEVAHSVVDYQHVMDELDDNILVADKDEVVLYVNDAYIRHTGIAPEQILGKRITELLETGTYFTDPTVPEVIRSRKKVMKLSSMFGRPDSLGFVTGVPIFDDAGEIQYVVACNRGVSTFKELRDNFVHFVEAVNNLQGAAGHVQMVPNSSGIVTPQMVGESPAIQRVYDLIENVRQTTATVLITGESGVGKELIADAIYRTSSRAEKPFIKVNCASIPASLFESELFGYERGSFSGANASGKQGLFEAANNGTLLLDEIGEMPMDMQAKLLLDGPKELGLHVHGHAGQAPSGHPEQRNHPGRGNPAHQAGYPLYRLHQLRFEEKGAGGHLPQRSVLPSPRDSHSGTTPAGAGRGCCPAQPAFCFGVQ